MTYLSKNRFVTDLSKTTLSPQCCSIEGCQENTAKWCHLSKLKFCQKHSNTHHTLDSYKVHKVESYKHQDFEYCPKHRRRYTRQDIETTELFCDECLLYEKKYYNRKVQTFWNIEEASDYCVSTSQITKTKLCNKTLRYMKTKDKLKMLKNESEKNKIEETVQLSQNQKEMIEEINKIFRVFSQDIEKKTNEKTQRIEDKINYEKKQIKKLEGYEEIGKNIQEAYKLKVNTYVIKKYKEQKGSKTTFTKKSCKKGCVPQFFFEN